MRTTTAGGCRRTWSTAFGGYWRALDAATATEALNQPTLRLHPLKGDLKGFWTVTVRANWRIVFRFEDGKILDVDLIDYH